MIPCKRATMLKSTLNYFVESLELRISLSAQPSGALDPTFGQGGSVWFTAKHALAITTVAAAALPGGKILLLGTANFHTSTDVFSSAIERLNPDGSPDMTFGTGGIRLLSAFGGGGAGQPTIDPSVMVVDRRGRIYVGGHDGLTRLLPDGSVDRSFGGDFGVDGFAANINAIAIQPDGDILLAGYHPDATSAGFDDGKHNFSIERIHPKGIIDTTFGDRGRTIVTFKTPTGRINSAVHALSIDGHGRILAAGGEDGQFDLVRLMHDGSLDASFGDQGIAVVPGDGVKDENSFGGRGAPSFTSILQRPSDGQIIAAGGFPQNAFDTSRGGPLVVVAFKPSGKPDLRFGDHGVVRLELSAAPGFFDDVNPRRAIANGIAFIGRNRLLISGTLSSASGPSGVLLTRLNDNGSPDLSFAPQLAVAPGSTPSEGLHFIPTYGSGSAINTGLIATRRGRFFLPVTGSPVFWSYAGFAALRLNPDGSLDLSYGKAGIGTASISYPDQQTPVRLLTGPDGRIYLTLDGDDQSHLVTLKPNGSTDASFSLDGARTSLSQAPSGTEHSVIAVQPDGKRLVEDRRLNDGVALVRYNTDGSIDNTFGNGGYVQFGGGPASYSLDKVLIRADGSLILDVLFVNGFIYPAVNKTIYSLDATGHFNASYQVPSVTFFSSHSTYVDMALAANGALVLATHTPDLVTGKTISSLLTQRDPVHLTVDPSYGVAGSVGLSSAPRAISVLPDGRTIVAGANVDNGVIVRTTTLTAFTTPGAVDSNFAQRTDVLPDGVNGSSAGDLLALRDGTILLVSRSDRAKPLFVTRYLSDGSLDTAFGNSGVLLLPAGSTTVALQQNATTESLLVAGAVQPAQTSPYDTAKTESTAFLQRFNL
jgi:uncharacterized delta-60 repeat protein